MVEEDNGNDGQGTNNEIYQENECVVGNISFIENFTMLYRDDSTIPIDELYVQLDANKFIDNNPSIDGHNANSDNEEESSSNYDTKIEYIENSEHEQSSSRTNDTNYDTE
jgi:hypothetical protein